jgi:hypothetical protein
LPKPIFPRSGTAIATETSTALQSEPRLRVFRAGLVNIACTHSEPNQQLSTGWNQRAIPWQAAIEAVGSQVGLTG